MQVTLIAAVVLLPKRVFLKLGLGVADDVLEFHGDAHVALDLQLSLHESALGVEFALHEIGRASCRERV